MFYATLCGESIGQAVLRVFKAECALFQFDLSTRAGTDSVGHMVRAATDGDPTLT